MVGLEVFQALLNGIGWILAWIYDVVGNFGVSIIILTLLIRLVLLPLGIKQIKSMQAMQAIQPRVKEIQKKFKGNKQRAQEETMKLYKEAGVNPLGGCLPLLLQFPILIAMYAVIRPPQLVPTTLDGKPAYELHNSHLPVDSQLFQNIVLHERVGFLGVNLQCSAAQSGSAAKEVGTDRKPVAPNVAILGPDGKPLGFHPTTGPGAVDCGSNTTDKIPYFVVLALMIATMFYQQYQMQKASPPGAASQQQQTLLYIMPLMFGFIGYAFPAGLTVYWTVSNIWQIGQQYALLRAGHIGPEALERRMAEQRARGEKNDAPASRVGFIQRLQQRAENERKRRDQSAGRKPQPGKGNQAPRRGGSGKAGGPRPKPRPGGRPGRGSGGPSNPPKNRRSKPGGEGGSGDGEESS